MNTDTFMCSSDEKQTRSPLSLYSEYQRMEIEFRAPHIMPTSHWHGQVEVNVPFDGDVEYLINNEKVNINQGHITLFWACTPHQLTDTGTCQSMAILNLPMHLFLSWPLDKDLINHVTHGMVIKSLATQQLSPFEVRRWQQELNSPNEQIRQLAIDEIGLMLKRFSLSGWEPILVNKTSRTHKNSVSRHAQFYVSQMLGFIAENYDQALTINDVAEHVKLNANYAMGIFQRVMQLTMKQYITAMRINHVRALLSDTDKSILDIALTAGFRSSSRFYSTFGKYVGMSPQHIIKDYLRFLNKDLSQIPVWQRSATPILTLPCLTPDVFRVAAQHSMMPAETESEKERTRALLFTVLSRFLDSKKFLSLMMYMLRNCVSDSVYQIIESDIHKDWNLSMVASCLCLSPSLLKKKLKSENTSYSQIITTCRMRYAVNELMMDGKNISQVSQSCGYNSTSYFISVFKDFYGMTPLHYVSQHRERTVA